VELQAHIKTTSIQIAEQARKTAAFEQNLANTNAQQAEEILRL
jgi:hypothetical protein